MKSRRYLVGPCSAAILYCVPYPVLAQVETPASDQRCWFAGESFTQGATLGAEYRTVVCTENGAWETANIPALACIYEGKAFGVGAVVAVTGTSGNVLIECATSGSWRPMQTPALACTYDGKAFGADAVVAVTGASGNVLIKCADNGTWDPTEAR